LPRSEKHVGTHHRDDLAQICADRLRVPLDAVVVRGSNTQLMGWRLFSLLKAAGRVRGRS
jgi:hypothetical protein